VRIVTKSPKVEPLFIFSISLSNCEHFSIVPAQEVSLSDWDNVSVSLTWRSPRSDGGRPVTHYLIDQKGKYDIDFTQVFATEGTATFFHTLL
jgi:hypothetical protein